MLAGLLDVVKSFVQLPRINAGGILQRSPAPSVIGFWIVVRTVRNRQGQQRNESKCFRNHESSSYALAL